MNSDNKTNPSLDERAGGGCNCSDCRCVECRCGMASACACPRTSAGE